MKKLTDAEMKFHFAMRDASLILTDLTRLARGGDFKAAETLHGILYSHVSTFRELCNENPALFKPIAEKLGCWPGLLTCDADVEKSNRKQIAQLALGEKARVKYSGSYLKKPWSRNTTAVYVALRLLVFVQSYHDTWQRRGETRKRIRAFQKECPKANLKRHKSTIPVSAKDAEEFRLYDVSFELAKQLQPFSRANYLQWWEAAKPVLLARYGKDFENHKRFAKYWNNADTLSAREQKKERGLVRREITKSLRQAFRTIAPQ